METKNEHFTYIVIVAIVAVTALVVLLQSGERAVATGNAVLQANGMPCTTNVQCQSYLCGALNSNPLQMVCKQRSSGEAGSACAKLSNYVGKEIVGNDLECSSGVCGVSGTSPLTMACEDVFGKKLGTPCGRDVECRPYKCGRLPGEQLGVCS